MSEATRRRFMSASAGWLAAGSAGVLAAADKLEPVRVAVIGSGARGSDLIRTLSTIEGVELTAICDDYPPHLHRGLKYAGPQAQSFADYRRLLDQARPRAVVLAVPLARHYAIARDVLAAGCDLFCEKTMCYSIDQAVRLAEQVRQSRRVFQVGLQRRANPIYQQAAAMVRAGVLGQVTAIRAQWHRHNDWRRPVPVARDDPQWNALERRLNWRLYHDTSGGLMTELGSHQMDVANWVLDATPRRVMASGGIDYWRDGREVCDNVFCTYEYELPAPPQPTAGAATAPRVVRVSYSSLCNNAYEGASELIMGTAGTLFLTSTQGFFYRERAADPIGWSRRNGDQNAAIVTAGKTLKLPNSPWAHRGEPLELDYVGGDDTRDELVSFVDHVRRNDPRTICDAAEGLRDTATVLMANQAMDSGSTVEWPLAETPAAE